jgi:hypothetical protein
LVDQGVWGGGHGRRNGRTGRDGGRRAGALRRSAGALDPGQRQVLAGILTAAQFLNAHGDQAGLDQLLEDAPDLLKNGREDAAR